MSNNKNVPQLDQPEISNWQPDIYYFPSQVDAELNNIQSNFLGKTLTLIDTLGLDPKREKAVKDLIRTIVKEQMIKSRNMLDNRLNKLFNLGMKPIDTTMQTNNFFFKSYIVTSVYEEKDMGNPSLN